MEAETPTPPALAKTYAAAEFKLIRLRELPWPDKILDTPDRAFDFWEQHIATANWYRFDNECFCTLFLNTRRVVKGFNMCSMGTLDSLLVHPRDVFRAAISHGAAAIVLAHNHPSGDPTPSEGDIKVTRDLIRAGQLLKIEVLDHVIIGRATEQRPRGCCSLRELGYFYS